MVEQFHGGLGRQGIAIRLSSTMHGPQERCEDFFAPGGDARRRDSLGDSRMSSLELMAALVSQNRFEGKVLRVGVALKRLGIHGQ